MNFLDLAPHLLADETVVGMPLGHGAQLAHVQGFTQIHLHEPTASSDSFDLDVVRFFLNPGGWGGFFMRMLESMRIKKHSHYLSAARSRQ